MLIDLGILVGGLIVLIIGGEFLVKGAVGIAFKAHLSTLVIGLTVVSFGTSAPELLVSIQAAYKGAPDIAIGNVVGSNIANISLVLGITVMVYGLTVARDTKIYDWPKMFLSSILFYIFAYDGIIVWFEGMIMLILLVLYIAFIVTKSRKQTKKEIAESDEEELEAPSTLGKSFLFLAIGLVGLYFGATWLLQGSVSLAQEAGLSERVIGITIIAFGTSVPELITCVVAAYRKETAISIGNLIGSNIFNIMAVIGITAIIHPIKVSQPALDFDFIWMIGFALLLLPMIWLGKKVGFWKGLILFGTYVTYIVLLLIDNSAH
ncbi:calcium/sodium antiporter [Lishizhenia sp.]|uniref:calcium/sodium antiporter n=1 Tax=Lishizhenia sp. TaxID=2497594 RepID=UPI00299D1839|nr:calcium/sodium antiporter [Lishizhenia sp.]MDX1446403.1 calcium/sodium antiporter [Lishizhenia sp.]